MGVGTADSDSLLNNDIRVSADCLLAADTSALEYVQFVLYVTCSLPEEAIHEHTIKTVL